MLNEMMDLAALKLLVVKVSAREAITINQLVRTKLVATDKALSTDLLALNHSTGTVIDQHALNQLHLYIVDGTHEAGELGAANNEGQHSLGELFLLPDEAIADDASLLGILLGHEAALGSQLADVGGVNLGSAVNSLLDEQNIISAV